MIKCLIITAVLFCTAVAVGQQKALLPYSDYFTVREGLPHFYEKITKARKATVSFLGGSITFNPGWRDKVCAYLKDRFPGVSFRFIAAGIPSLGSLPHAFRLQRDLLDSGKTDLLFVEAAVNDRVNGTDSTTQLRALEGIIRHARKANPFMDIIMMAFADPGKTSDYNNGIVPTEINNQEMVAAHYHLPSINLAKAVRDKINNKEFSWEADFKNIHPSPFGQELYFAAIKTLLDTCLAPSTGNANDRAARPLPPPLDKASLETGKYYDITNARFVSGWTLDKNWAPRDSLGTREGFVHIPMLVATQPGALLSLDFKGTAIGVAVVSGGDAGIISWSIDGAPFKNIDLYTQWSSWLHLPWYVLFDSDLKNTNHRLQIRISDSKNNNSKGNACRIAWFLVNGGDD